MMNSVILELRGVDKLFDDFVAVERVNLSVNDGEFFTIVGPSGSGKTTMIRMLVGMDSPTRGDILLRGERINDVPANKRPTCMVFQSLALFPHKTVGENIEFPLKIRGDLSHDRRSRALELLRQLRLPEDYYYRMISQCSGGERQRVALARALAFDPDILFFDEPLSALDYRLRKTLEKELKDIQRETGKTFVYITHSIEEAMVMSDRIAIMRDGRVIQVGSPEALYHHPCNAFVAQFMGDVNRFDVHDDGSGSLIDAHSGASYPRPTQGGDGQGNLLLVRPERMHMLGPDDDADAVIAGRILNVYALGSRTQYQIAAGEQLLLVESMGDDDTAQANESVRVGWFNKDALLLSA